MPIPGPGVPISMNTIAGEFGGTVPHSLSEYYRGGGLVPNTPTNAAIPTSGTISMGSFYGSANRSIVSLFITGNTYNYDVFNNRGPAYVAGATDLTVTVNPGVVVGSTSTGAYAMLVPSSFNPGDTVTIVNNGTIVGTGGNGGSWVSGANPSTPGSPAGNAIFVNRPTTITNNGTIGGGGGGGGSGGSRVGIRAPAGSGGGGGGGAGFNGGAGGAGGPIGGIPGSPGSTFSAGSGGAGGAPGPAGPGGPGGFLGNAGAAGTSSPNIGGGAGGAGGLYIVGNPFVTWPATGTRYGGAA